MSSTQLPDRVRCFDGLPGSALLRLSEASCICGRSNTALYRHFEAGELTPVKIGGATMIRVADLRKFIGAASSGEVPQ